jgi:putative tricarboxylic transport membrane protein
MDARKADPAGIATAVGLFALAGIIAFDVTGLGGGMAYGIGPQAMPLVVAAGLAILAIGNLVLAWRGELPERESADPRAVLLILGGFVALIALIAFGGGFIVATAILFATTSAAFGRKALLTDLVIGAALALIIFLIFDKLLTLSLPAGPLERLL